MKGLVLLTVLLCCFVFEAETENIIRFGYSEEGNIPVIENAPDNSGLYYDIFSAAAEKIGYKLHVIRMPKRRVLYAVEEGEVDFYPGFSYNAERAKVFYYFRNGLVEADAALSLASLPEIIKIEQIDEHGYTVLVPLGGSAGKQFKNFHEIPNLSVERAAQVLSLIPKRGDIFIYRKSSIDYFFKSNPAIYSKFRIHTKPWEPEYMYLGFSKKSKLARYIANPNYKAFLPQSELNQPEKLDPNCTASKFMEAILEIEKSGEIDALYMKYYGVKRLNPK